MMKFKNLVLAAALITGGIGGISSNAVASTVMVSIEKEVPAVQSQGAGVPFIDPAGLPEPASWMMLLLGFASLGLVGFTGKSRSRRDLIPSVAEAKI